MPSQQNPEFIPLLLGALAELAEARGSRLTKIRLVKFLYLFDLYWAQAEKHTYTNWSWAFVYYGPYCRESTDAIDLAEKTGFLAAEAYESHYRDEDFRLYRPGKRITEADIDKVLSSMPIHVSACLTRAVRRWYDDTYGLLDYVYFRTGPMARAKPGDALSFAEETMPNFEALRPVKMQELSSKKKLALREAIKKIGKKNPLYHESPELFDKEYFDSLSRVEGPETETGVSGIAKLNFDGASDD